MIIDKLLQTDIDEIKAMPKSEIELPRLKEKFGEGTIKIQGINTDRLQEIYEMNQKHTADGNKTDEVGMMLEIIVEGTIDPNFRDSRLLEKFHTEDPGEIVKSVFLTGEIRAIGTKIIELCGIDAEKMSQVNIDKEIKN